MSYTKEALSEDYRFKVPIYEILEKEANYILKAEFENSKIKIHSILSRIKSFESFYEKAERKKLEDPLHEIKDILGLRIVCLFLSDIERINAKLRNAFDVISEDNKINGYDDMTKFGYMSHHFVVKMKPEYTGPRYDKIKGLKFEIQVRTITMDAWANISHYLSYKTEDDIPKDLKRDYYALSGLFYVGDTHFELFYKESKKSEESYELKVKNIIQDEAAEVTEEINLDSLKAYLNAKYPDRKSYKNKDLSQLVTELNSVGINNINALEDMYKKAWEVFLLLEKDSPPSGGRYSGVGVIRGLLDLTSEAYRLKYKRSDYRSKLDSYIKLVGK